MLNKILTQAVSIFLILFLLFSFNESNAQCNTNQTICASGTAGPFNFVSKGPKVGTCLDWIGPSAAYITLYITTSGPLEMLINGNATSGFLDVAVFNIPPGQSPCTAIQNNANQIGCNYASNAGGCNQFGNSFSCNSSVPSPNVTAGQVIMIVVENWSGNSSSFTLDLGPLPAAQTGPPDATILPTGPFCVNSSPTQLQATNMGGTWSGPGTSSTGVFNPATAGPGTHTINYSIGIAPCNSSSSTTVTVNPVPTVTASPAVVCVGQSTILTAMPDTGVTYSWSPGGQTTQTITVSPSVNTTYTVTVDYGTCSQSVSQLIQTVAPPVVTVNPVNAALCSGTIPITATSTFNGAPCPDCNYTWTGSASQVDNGVPSSTIANAGAGVYNVTVSSPTGCVGNTVTSNIYSPASPPSPSCDVIYVSTTGGGNGQTKTTPTDLPSALAMAACNSVVIKMAVGTYTISAPITSLTSFVTIEGGYDPTFTTKTSQAGATTIFRDNTNVQGLPNTGRLIAFQINGASNFRLQDLTIQVDDAPVATVTNPYGISTYGINMNGCSDYNIVRCQILVGNASAGMNGVNGENGAIGGNGANGSAGHQDNDGRPGSGGGGGGGGGTTAGNNGTNATGPFNSNPSSCTAGGAGGTAGAGGGNGGNGATGTCSCCGVGNPGDPGQCSGGARNGGGGGGGASGGRRNNAGAAGGSGGGVFAACTAQTGGGAAGPAGGCTGGNGTNGNSGVNGTNGSAGTAGSAGTHAGGFFNPGLQGGNGTDGTGGQGGKGGGAGAGQNNSFISCIGGAGSGGGGGGGGGSAGSGGTAGYGGGSAFGIYLFNNGANGNVLDCNIQQGIAGTGGAGGIGGMGANGGAGGLGSPYRGSTEVGRGGDGGAGGSGGNGGNGGVGIAGVSMDVYTDPSSTPLSANINLNLAAQPVIVVDNIACIDVDIAHTSAGGPNWTSFGSGSNPSSGSGSPAITQYSTTGRKSVDMGGNTYTGFNNILVAPPAVGTILASSAGVCPGTATFTSSIAGTSGIIYNWSVIPTATINFPDSSTTTIDFSNNTSSTITYTITLNLASECCGNLGSVTTTIDVYPHPDEPTALDENICSGGTVTFTALTPTGVNYQWYDAASGGTLLFSGNPFIYGPATSNEIFYIQSVSQDGCVSVTRFPVNLIIDPAIAPDPFVGTTCDTGLVAVTINPVAGADNYYWYDAASGGALLQSGSSWTYYMYLPTPGSSQTVYVSAQVAGCDESQTSSVTMTVTSGIISTVIPVDTVCPGQSYILDVQASDGNPGTVFTYSWDPIPAPDSALANPTVNPWQTTSYNVTITSDQGCSVTERVLVHVGSNMDVTMSKTDISCFGANNGQASATVNIGDPPIDYLWIPGNIPTASISNLGPGTYVVNITDASGCMHIDSVTIVEPNAIVITVDNVTSAYCTNPNGDITVSATGGTGALSYSWSNSQIGQTATGLLPGNYIVTVTDANNCNATETVTVGDIPSPIILIAVADSATCGGTNGQAVVIASGGNEPYSYLWNPTNQSNALATDLPPGVYIITVTDADNCITTETVEVFDRPSTMVLTGGSQGATCGENNGWASVSADQGNAPYSYVWYPDTVLTDSLFNLGAGSYTVIVTDALGCVDSLLIAVSDTTALIASFDANPQEGLPPLDVAFTNNSSGNIDSYSWNFGNDSTSANINPNYTYVESGEYLVVLTVSNQFGCTDTASVTIVVDAISFFEMPNVFSPNGDGVNDIFRVNGSGLESVKAEIYNRWGNKVYEWDGPNGGWDGRSTSGIALPDGVYYYIITAKGLDGVDYGTVKGTVTLIR
jgi:gliding motility-associated-like protein